MFCNSEIDWSATGSMLSAYGGLLSAIAAFITLYFVWVQLKKINNSLIDSNVMKVLEIEFELNRRRERVVDFRKSMTEILIDVSAKESKSKTDNLKIEAAKKYYDAAQENYLNCLDRLCFFIISGKFSEDDFKEDYKKLLRKEVSAEEFSKNTNNTDYYKNIISLDRKWNQHT